MLWLAVWALLMPWLAHFLSLDQSLTDLQGLSIIVCAVFFLTLINFQPFVLVFVFKIQILGLHSDCNYFSPQYFLPILNWYDLLCPFISLLFIKSLQYSTLSNMYNIQKPETLLLRISVQISLPRRAELTCAQILKVSKIVPCEIFNENEI